MKIYTRRGDSGETDLFGGARVAKDDLRVEAYGAVDELNAALGWCAATSGCADVADALRAIQPRLFALGAYLAMPPSAGEGAPLRVGPADVQALEERIDSFEAELAPLKRFILPGGTQASAALHLARTICRRAERRAVALHAQSPLAEVALRYLNRLSDLLFVMARVENRRANEPDVEWDGRGD